MTRAIRHASTQHLVSAGLLLYLPLILATIQSFYKIEVVTAFGIALPGFDGQLSYFSLRMLFLLWFALNLMNWRSSRVLENKPAIDPSDSVRREHDPLLILRGFAGLNVFFGHWFLIVFSVTDAPRTIADQLSRTILGFSPWFGVWVFFTLSGYLMGKGFVSGRYQLTREGITRLYKNRLLRIVPIYVVSILLVTVFVKPELLIVNSSSSLVTWLDTLFMDTQTGGPIGALWSVSTEFQFYLLVPLLFLILGRFLTTPGKQILGISLILSTFACLKYAHLLVQPETWSTKVYAPLLPNFDCFLVGMLGALIVHECRIREIKMKKGILFGWLTFSITQIAFSFWSNAQMVTYAGAPGSGTRTIFLAFAPSLAALATALIIGLFELAARRPPRYSAVLWRIFSGIGTLTYCIYVFHEPIILSIRRIYPPTLTFWESLFALPIGLGATFAVAYVMHRLVEKPFDERRVSRQVEKQANN